MAVIEKGGVGRAAAWRRRPAGRRTRSGSLREQVTVFGARAGGLDCFGEGGAGFSRAALVLEDEHQVAAGLDEQRVELHGAADEGLGFARAAVRRTCRRLASGPGSGR